ncbi:MAG: DsbA family protein [Burkholderiales bacterium]
MAGEFDVDLYWSFRSPYSYLALSRVAQFAARYPVGWNVRVVYPLAIRKPGHFKGIHPLARPYFLRDCVRVAEYLGVPFARPQPDPIVQDPVTLEIAESQPYIYRLTLLGAEATLRGRVLPFVDQVSRLLWDGSVKGWNQGDHLARATARAGLDLEEMEQAIAAAPEPREALIESNQVAQQAAGHWGVPLFVFENEPFFGQDRMDVLMWRMQQRGLRPRV